MSLPPSIILDLLVLLIPLSHHSNYKEEERREKREEEERREKREEERRRKKKEERRKKKEERRKKKSTQYGTVHKALIHNFLKLIIILFIIYLLESHVSVHPIPLLRIPIPRFLIISTI